MAAGIRSVGTALGEGQLPLADLAARHGSTVDAVRELVGRASIFESSASAIELGARAAQACLARAGVAASEVPVVLFSTASGSRTHGFARLELLERSGLGSARVIEVGTSCEEILTGVRMARLLVEHERVDHVLVVSADVFPWHNDLRMLERWDGGGFAQIYSDGAGALLIAPCRSWLILGAGAANDGALWNAWVPVGEAAAATGLIRNPGLDTRAYGLAMMRLHRAAIAEALAAAHVTIEQISYVVGPTYGPMACSSNATIWEVTPDKVVMPQEGQPTHVGGADIAFGLERLLDRARPGELVLLVHASMGAVRALVVRA
jgi:3-oxoacyl-[acyl-carrier-protein] synthase-3